MQGGRDPQNRRLEQLSSLKEESIILSCFLHYKVKCASDLPDPCPIHLQSPRARDTTT